MESKIKLFPIGEPMENGTQRLQSQLYLSSQTADFILENEVLKVWGFEKEKGFGFHETNKPYEIVNSKKEIKKQQL